ncbi:MAG: 3-deoxy-D-manno-octulosonic acid transferase, partial [Rhizobiales bacterium]|nr:3-deoxy-D-manno-octulosonic acid transferase [Hyphomicrobiales bacterium]
MQIMGDIAIKAYCATMQLMRPLFPFLLSYRRKIGKEHPDRHTERLAHTNVSRPDGPVIWVHAASVGETNAVMPLCHKLADLGFIILLTNVTRTAAQIVAERVGNDPRFVHQFAPLDIPSVIRRFLNHWQPQLALSVESEIWPATVIELNARDIPLVIVNGRMSDRSFKRWYKVSFLTKALFGRFSQIHVRGEEDLLRFQQLGGRKIAITGNMKYDAPTLKVAPEVRSAFSAAVKNRPVFLASSTHEGEDAIVLQAHAMLAETFPDLLTCIVPRHPERGRSIQDLAVAKGMSVRLRSLADPVDDKTQIYVADTLGELGLFYAIANVAFIGGSLLPIGGHNPIEAVHLNCPVLTGPQIFNFREVFGVLQAGDGCELVDNAEELAQKVRVLIEDPIRAAGMCANAKSVLSNLN